MAEAVGRSTCDEGGRSHATKAADRFALYDLRLEWMGVRVHTRAPAAQHVSPPDPPHSTPPYLQVSLPIPPHAPTRPAPPHLSCKCPALSRLIPPPVLRVPCPTPPHLEEAHPRGAKAVRPGVVPRRQLHNLWGGEGRGTWPWHETCYRYCVCCPCVVPRRQLHNLGEGRATWTGHETCCRVCCACAVPSSRRTRDAARYR